MGIISPKYSLSPRRQSRGKVQSLMINFACLHADEFLNKFIGLRIGLYAAMCTFHVRLKSWINQNQQTFLDTSY